MEHAHYSIKRIKNKSGIFISVAAAIPFVLSQREPSPHLFHATSHSTTYWLSCNFSLYNILMELALCFYSATIFLFSDSVVDLTGVVVEVVVEFEYSLTDKEQTPLLSIY